MLYMFRAVPPPIIRSSKTVHKASSTLSNVWQSTRCYIYSFWVPDDGRRNRLKHVQHCTEINKLCKVAYCWLYLKIRLQCTDPWMSKSPIISWYFTQLIYTNLCNPYPTAFPYGNGMVLHFYQQQESSTTKTVHKVINKRLKTYV